MEPRERNSWISSATPRSIVISNSYATRRDASPAQVHGLICRQPIRWRRESYAGPNQFNFKFSEWPRRRTSRSRNILGNEGGEAALVRTEAAPLENGS